MRSDNTAHLRTAARGRSERTRREALAALRRLDEAGAPITFEALAREAGVSRSWLYSQSDLRTEVQQLRARAAPPPTTPATPERQRASTASLLRRLQAADERIRRLETENRQLRDALATALGTARQDGVRTTPHGHDTPGTHQTRTRS